MSGGFNFPPPPPPPPKAAQPSQGADSNQYNSQQPQRGRGRGRGRGGNDGRGRGSGGPSSRGSGQAKSHRGGYPNQQHGSNTFQHNPQHIASGRSPTLPPGTHINPNFVPPPNAAHQSYNHGSDYPSRSTSGHKRKLDALRPPAQEIKTLLQTAPAVPSFGAPILPPKPPQVQVQPSSSPPRSKPASNLFGFSADDGDHQYSFSDPESADEDLDEEAAAAELGEKLTFEHNGMVLSLKSTADIAAWQRERKRNWPTKARMSERQAERWRVGEERKRLLARAVEFNASAMISRASDQAPKTRRFSQDGEAAALVESSRSTATSGMTRVTKPESSLEKAKRELGQQEANLQALRKRVAKGEAFLKRERSRQTAEDAAATNVSDKAPLQEGGDEDEHHVEADSDTASVLSESSVVTSDSSDGSSESNDDDDGPPEEATAKQHAFEQITSQRPVCRYFAASGHCRDGDGCRYRHELSESAKRNLEQSAARPQQPRQQKAQAQDESKEKKGIYQRLLEQQQEEEDRLALQVIKYLGKASFFSVDGMSQHSSET